MYVVDLGNYDSFFVWTNKGLPYFNPPNSTLIGVFKNRICVGSAHLSEEKDKVLSAWQQDWPEAFRSRRYPYLKGI